MTVHPPFPVPARLPAACLAGLFALLLGACAALPVDEAERLSREGRYEEALAVLDDALQHQPDLPALRTAHSRQRDRVVVQALARAEVALASGRLDEADRLAERARALAPGHVRLAAIDVQRAQQRAVLERQARARASALHAAGTPVAAPPPLPATLSAAFQKPLFASLFRGFTLRASVYASRASA